MSQDDFLITGGATFAPTYVPTRFSVSKERNTNREENFCGNEDVTDMGAKNRELHIAGRLRSDELAAFNSVLDYGSNLEIVTPGWTGDIYVLQGEIDGPVSYDPRSGLKLYEYSIDVVSSGANEPGRSPHDNGIISEGY